MTEVTAGSAAEIIVISIAAFKIIDVVFNIMMKKIMPTDNNCISKQEKAELLRYSRELFNMHNKFDADGVPIWYVPRSWADTQGHILETVHEVAHIQEKLADTMERCVGILDRIDRRNSS